MIQNDIIPIPIKVCPAVPENIPVMAGFLQAMARESENLKLDSEILRRGIQQVFDQSVLGQYWLMENVSLGQPMGMCLITPEWSDWYNRPYWWIQSVYITPENRGQGLMQVLLTQIETAAKAAGVVELRLYVEQQNTRAIRAYEKLNFTGDHYQMMQKTLK